MLGFLSDTLFGQYVNSLSDVLFWFLFAQTLLMLAITVCIALVVKRNRSEQNQQPKTETEPSPQPQAEQLAEREEAQAQAAAAQPQLVEEQPPVEQPAEQPVEQQPDEEVAEQEPLQEDREESHEAGTLRYDRSFLARLIQSDDNVKRRYTLLKNELLSYKGVKSRISWKRETFKAGRRYVARLAFRGKTLCIFLPLDIADYADGPYQLEQTDSAGTYKDTPALYRLRNEKHFKLSLVLVNETVKKLGLVRTSRVPEDYYMPYEGIVQLIEKGLARREIKSAEDEAIFSRDSE